MSRRRQLMAGLCCEDTGRGAATVAASSRVRTRCLPHATMLHSCGQVRHFVAGRVAIGGKVAMGVWLPSPPHAEWKRSRPVWSTTPTPSRAHAAIAACASSSTHTLQARGARSVLPPTLLLLLSAAIGVGFWI